MVFTKSESVKASDFNKQAHAELDHFSFSEDSIICHYTKDGKAGQFAAKDWMTIKAMWNYNLF